MALSFELTSPADIERLSAFLLNGFNAPVDAVFAQPQVLRWKYFDPGPDWESSRSYVLAQGDNIKAHCGVWPMNLQFGSEQISCVCFLDWLSARDLPGAGVSLKKKLMRLAETSIVVGGSAETRAVVPHIGFKEVGEVATFVRVVRPWKQFRSRPKEGALRGGARLLRNTGWSYSTQGAIAPGLSVKRVESFTQLPSEISDCGYPTPWRSADYLNYWLQMPGADLAGYEIQRNEKFFGYFLLSVVNRQTRIADMRLLSQEVDDWANAYRLAGIVAAEDERTCETMTIASTPLIHRALSSSGFKNRGAVPLYIADPKSALQNLPPMFLNLIDGDGAYLNDPEHPYVS